MNEGVINGFAINSAPQGVNIDCYLLGEVGNKSTGFGINDFFTPLADSVSYWKLEADTTGNGSYVELPCEYFKIITWSYRFGLPFGGSNIAEVLVPSATQYLATITSGIRFRLKVFYKSGITQEHVFFTFGSSQNPPIPLTKDFVKTNNQDSCLIKGGTVSSVEGTEVVLSYNRNLLGIRQNSVTAQGRKVICNLDPVLLPGMTVNDGTNSFTALTVSYFASASDQYMEVNSYYL